CLSRLSNQAGSGLRRRGGSCNWSRPSHCRELISSHRLLGKKEANTIIRRTRSTSVTRSNALATLPPTFRCLGSLTVGCGARQEWLGRRRVSAGANGLVHAIARHHLASLALCALIFLELQRDLLGGRWAGSARKRGGIFSPRRRQPIGFVGTSSA